MSTIGDEIGSKESKQLKLAVTDTHNNYISFMDLAISEVPYGENIVPGNWLMADEITEKLQVQGYDVTIENIRPALSTLHSEGSLRHRKRAGASGRNAKLEYNRVYKHKRAVEKTKSGKKVSRKASNSPDGKVHANPIQQIEDAVASIESAMTALKQQQVIMDNLKQVLDHS